MNLTTGLLGNLFKTAKTAMVVSTQGDPNIDPLYYNPYVGAPKKGPLVLGNPQLIC